MQVRNESNGTAAAEQAVLQGVSKKNQGLYLMIWVICVWYCLLCPKTFHKFQAAAEDMYTDTSMNSELEVMLICCIEMGVRDMFIFQKISEL